MPFISSNLGSPVHHVHLVVPGMDEAQAAIEEIEYRHSDSLCRINRLLERAEDFFDSLDPVSGEKVLSAAEREASNLFLLLPLDKVVKYHIKIARSYNNNGVAHRTQIMLEHLRTFLDKRPNNEIKAKAIARVVNAYIEFDIPDYGHALKNLLDEAVKILKPFFFANSRVLFDIESSYREYGENDKANEILTFLDTCRSR